MQKKDQSLKQISLIKRNRILTYPYYPLASCFSKNQIEYLLAIDSLGGQCPSVTVVAFRDGQQLMSSYCDIEVLPKKVMTEFKVISMEVKETKSSVTVEELSLLVGFYSGQLVLVNYKKRRSEIVGRFNRNPYKKQGLIKKVNNFFFEDQDMYETCISKPVYTVNQHSHPNQKYKFSYRIGNRLLMSDAIQETKQNQTIRIHNSVSWDQISKTSFKESSMIIKSNKTVRTPNCILMDWDKQISSYCYTPKHQLIVASRQDNSITSYNLEDMGIKRVWKFDLDIKRVNYSEYQGNEYLLILPYDNNLYIVDITHNLTSSLTGHRSYITNSVLNNSGLIVSGGCDHRIGLKNLQKIKNWAQNSNSTSKEEGPYLIQSDKVNAEKFGEIYFLDQFRNVNESRNNTHDYGFGNFVEFSNGSKNYAFMTFDFLIKIFRIAPPSSIS